MDAYILSESSMFITKRRFILKTCGTTTPLECLKEMLNLAKKYTGFDAIEVIIFISAIVQNLKIGGFSGRPLIPSRY